MLTSLLFIFSKKDSGLVDFIVRRVDQIEGSRIIKGVGRPKKNFNINYQESSRD